MLLQVHHLYKELDGKTILEDIGFQLSMGEKVGLVGDNGGGKSTLIRLLAGQLQADGGTIRWAREAKAGGIGYLAQSTAWHPHDSLANQLQDVPSDTLTQVGLTPDLLARTPDQLSGGEKTRAALALALRHHPAVLLMDEPTNHLDVEGLTWLETFLVGYGGAVLVVSHDRTFLDHVVTRTLELHHGTLHDYPGNYSAYAHQKAMERQRQQAEYEAYVKEKQRLEASYDRRRQWAEQAHRAVPKYGGDFYGASAKRMMQGAKALERRLQRLEPAEKPERKRTMNATLHGAHNTRRHLVVAEDLGFRYGTAPWLFRDARFDVERGERVGIIGSNGTGKSTLIQLIRGTLPATRGTVRISPVRVGYLAQEHENLALDATVLDAVRGEDVTFEGTDAARRWLAGLLFPGDDVYKVVRDLSGGEKMRVALARILFDAPDLLLLDEPTNALDLTSREAIEDALLAYGGTTVFVSHDRYLLQKVATKILVVSDGQVHTVRGGYEDYEVWLRRRGGDAGRVGARAVDMMGCDDGRSEGPRVEAGVVEPPSGDFDGRLTAGISREEQVLTLEMQIARLSQQMAVAADEEKDAIGAEFVALTRQLRALRER